MKDNASPLFSQYILDGVQMDETPFSALYDCLDGNGTVDTPKGPFADIVDEYMDKVPASFEYDEQQIPSYIKTILRSSPNRRDVDLSYPVFWTKAAIDACLLDCIFREGSFSLQDILLMAKWDWNNSPAGNMAAFYDSTVTAGRHLFDLGVRLDRYFVEENRHNCRLELSLRSRMSMRRKCPDTMVGGSSDWLIYIPFENARMHLGGSALSKLIGHGSGTEMNFQDPEYFVDCYEVVRELVEDGVIVAGTTVGYGGLACAAERFRGRKGFKMDIGNIISSRRGETSIRVLFAEMPGVLVQIRDIDYDYVDSQLLLQEVAYFPLGHPDDSMRELLIRCSSKDNITSILESLLNQASEGED